MPDRDTVMVVFFATWGVLGLASWIFFVRYKNIQVKRKILPPYLILIGLLFLFFVYLLQMPSQVYWVVVPGIGLITYFNIITIKFCDNCGASINKFPLSKIRYCAKCGAEITS